jgi:hypothetical protein
MNKTQLILFHRPYNSAILEDGTGVPYSTYAYRVVQNPNEIISQNFVTVTRPANKNGASGLALDLYDSVPIPITFSILDIREPEKRRTSWSKTITIPGTKNNNRIFSHVYEIGQDGWVTIGNTTVYEGFNPNLRKECIVMNDGVQVMKGNLQLKKIKRDKDGNIEYEIALNGDLTSLFYDVGTTKLADLDLSEWDHAWSKENIENSWYGVNKKSNGSSYTSIANGTARRIVSLFRDATTGRLGVETAFNHGLLEDDWVYINPYTGTTGSSGGGTSWAYLVAAKGEWVVTKRISATRFVVNYFYPIALMNSGASVTVPNAAPYESFCYKRTATGKGYVYPLISWGDEYDYNSFAVTNMAPAFYVKGIFDKIMSETNSTYQSTFLNSEFFKRLILTQKKTSYDLTPAELNDRKFCVGLTSSYLNKLAGLNTGKPVQTYLYPAYTSSLVTLTPQTSANYVPFKKEDGGIMGTTVSFYDAPGSTASVKNWDETQYKWIVKESGEYSLTANLKISAWIDMNGYEGSPADGTASFVQNNPLYEYRPRASFNNPSGPIGQNNTGIYIISKIMRKRNGFVEEIGSSGKSFDMNGNAVYASNNPNWKWFGRYQPASWENTTLSVPSSKTYFAEGDEVWVQVQSYVQAKSGQYSGSSAATNKSGVGFHEIYNPPGNDDPLERSDILADFYFRTEASSFIISNPNSTASEGSQIPVSSILPRDMACKDFLLSVIKMFNLHIESDKQIERLYYIEPRDTYYKTGSGGITDYVDWSSKVDKDSVDIIPMGELIAKYYTFQNKEENDFWNKKFKEDRGRSYSKYTKEVNNDFLKNESKIEIPLGTTMMINNPDGSDVVMPAIIQKEANTAAKPVSNSLPRMLIWGGLRPYTAQRGMYIINLNNAQGAQVGWEMLSSIAVAGATAATSSVYTTYPYAGTVDSPIDPQYDINWYNMEQGDFVYWDNARWTNENLYNKYWSNFINEISDPSSKVIVAKLRLLNKDIYNLDFRKIYVIDGHYLRLQKIIDYDPVNDGMTTCEFLKLKSPSKYSRRSVITDANGFANPVFSQVIDTTRPVYSEVIEIAPSKKKPQFGYQNTTPGVNLSNSSTVQTNGLSNYVGPGTKNVKVNGNENAIGSGAQNVHISSGNGNYVVGNVTNVNMIGTDKKYVAESDVTYINNIRYKDGIAISKSNVINGGFNVAVVRQSGSTTINVVNGGEDIVIEGGSSTYENVINAGQDAILPDVKELGITTTVNPNPRTNLSGVFTLNTGSQSVAQVIRQADSFRSLS